MPHSRRPLAALVIAAAGFAGLCGVALSAAAAHHSNSTLTATAGEFCLFHAGALLGLSAVIGGCPSPSKVYAGACGFLFFGVMLFSGELACAGLLDWRPFALAAPLGGGVLIVGWLLVLIGALGELWNAWLKTALHPNEEDRSLRR